MKRSYWFALLAVCAASLSGTLISFAPGDVSRQEPAAQQAVTATGTFTARTLANKLGDVVSVKDFGAIGDGASHPLSGIYGTLAAAQADYPAATSLSDELDYVALAKAIASLTYGKVYLPSGTYLLSGNLTITDGVSLYGDGCGNIHQASVLKCTSASAGITVTGGGVCQDFAVNGNSIGTLPIYAYSGSGRNWIGVWATDSAQDNWLIAQIQNCAFTGCQSLRAARDNLVLDWETGGHAFTRFESRSAGRYSLCIQQTRVSSSGYTQPTHVTFLHSIFEQNLGNSPLVYGVGKQIRFINCVAAQSTTGVTAPPWSIQTGGGWTLDGVYSTTVESTANHVSVASGSTINLVGRPYFNNGAAVIDAVAGAVVHNSSDSNLGGGVSFLSAATPNDGEGILQYNFQTPVWVRRVSTGNTALQVSLVSDAGARLRVFGDGSLGWGDGTDYTFPSRLSRLSGGDLSANVGIQATSIGSGGNKVVWGTLPPVSGTWTAGDVCWNKSVNSFQPEGWRCTNSGTPGTWTAMANHP